MAPESVPIYDKFSIIAFKKPKIAIVILSGIFALAAILFSIFNIPAGTISALIVSARPGSILYSKGSRSF